MVLGCRLCASRNPLFEKGSFKGLLFKGIYRCPNIIRGLGISQRFRGSKTFGL